LQNPIQHTALAGNALNITGTNPLYIPLIPSVFITSRKTSPMPLNLPSGAEKQNYKLRELPSAIPSSDVDVRTFGANTSDLSKFMVYPHRQGGVSQY